MSNSTSSVTESVVTYPAPEAGEKFDRLKTLLREMFQLDRGDLDFGLYRIMNMKAGEIEAFLDRDLLPQVKTVLAGVADEERERIEAELDSTIKQLTALKAPTEDNERVRGLRVQLAEAKADADAEADVYGHLANFFARYYNEGDFMSLRRYSGGGRATYLIPYDGEEVKLHWANADQYYIKTTENYAAYAFTVGEGEAERRVRFEIGAESGRSGAGRYGTIAPRPGANASRPPCGGEDHRIPRAVGGLPETPLAEEEIRSGNPMVRDLGPRAGGALPGNRRQRGAARGMGGAVQH